MTARPLPRAARAAARFALVCATAGSAACAQSTAPAGPMTRPMPEQASVEHARRQAEAESQLSDRMLIERASLRLEAKELPALRDRTAAAVAALGGFVENVELDDQRYPQRPSLRMALRVPAASLPAMLDTLRAAGRVRGENRSATDVTEQVVDADARLRNLIAVRDRLREHLTRAGNVTDVVAVERELARVQGEVDALEARLKYLRGSVAMARLDLHAEPPLVLGPLGYAFKGLGWVVAKLFVIR